MTNLVHAFEIPSEKLIRKYDGHDNNVVKSIVSASSVSDEFSISGCKDYSIKLWNFEETSSVTTLSAPYEVNRLTFLPN
jgi:WD40 repeat protein